MGTRGHVGSLAPHGEGLDNSSVGGGVGRAVQMQSGHGTLSEQARGCDGVAEASGRRQVGLSVAGTGHSSGDRRDFVAGKKAKGLSTCDVDLSARGSRRVGGGVEVDVVLARQQISCLSGGESGVARGRSVADNVQVDLHAGSPAHRSRAVDVTGSHCAGSGVDAPPLEEPRRGSVGEEEASVAFVGNRSGYGHGRVKGGEQVEAGSAFGGAVCWSSECGHEAGSREEEERTHRGMVIEQ
mmetsp:Transcript_41434/g.88382  ORF Transcript_41434/g.88382 Transcript_41434/m.88382 type:complete len:240 (-) Transcript_41434:63-782(-)